MNRQNSVYRSIALYTDVQSASSVGLIVLIYDRIDDSLARCERVLLANENPADVIRNLISLITEGLIGALDVDPKNQVSLNLFGIYSWANRQLIEVLSSRDLEAVRSVRGALRGLRDAWREVDAPTSRVVKSELISNSLVA